jgi:DNA repair photolyase
MNIIYEPSGKAREYADLACNLYTGCNHACLYCYAPAIRRMTREEYRNPIPRRNILADFKKDCRKYCRTESAVLFCFMTDPYNSAESELKITREALKLCLKYQIPVKILTKSKTVLNDLDVIKKFGSHITVGMTLTMDNDIDSLIWEPGASLPHERIETLKALHDAGIHTWASFEPVLDPVQSINMIGKVMDYVDHFKIGKLNNYKDMDKKINWTNFLQQVTEILRNKKPFYAKKDLRENAPSIVLYENEIQSDIFEPEFFPF